ncbi:maturation protein [ssRNA phage SRR5467091_6]|uniref:Maturation protein n=1 Tax=ssRNA phage SRR5467091_6 TaxID=2786471 RepID=A0A8S5KYU3_9VIRU|nr:maturation protein [ssRNA phage SRR5467091_6]DAD50910.1 TPA_asm: maturation protein [ssRNA phage SRR5467091_6]
MTTGSILRDGTTPYPTVDNPSASYGYYYRKNWTGADRPPTDYTFVIRRNPVNGRTYRKRVLSLRREIPHTYSMNALLIKSGVYGTVQGAVWQYYHDRIIPWSGAQPAFMLGGANPWGANDDIKLIAKLQERVYGSDFNPGIFLAELNQTLGLIGDLAVRVARVISYAKKGNLREASRVLARYEQRNSKRKFRVDYALSTSILEIQYGIRPLLQDMKEGAEWLAHMLHAPVSFKVSARRTVQKECSPNINGVSSIHYASASWETKKQIIAYLDEPPHNAVLQSLLNPEQILWEKTPLSFVADWAVPIGDYLQARGIASTLKGTFCITRTDVKTGAGLGFTPETGSYNYTAIIAAWPLTGIDDYYREVTVDRQVTSSLDVPRPEFKGFGKTFSWEHCLNGVALLTTVGRKTPDETLAAADSWLSRRIR